MSSLSLCACYCVLGLPLPSLGALLPSPPGATTLVPLGLPRRKSALAQASPAATGPPPPSPFSETPPAALPPMGVAVASYRPSGVALPLPRFPPRPPPPPPPTYFPPPPSSGRVLYAMDGGDGAGSGELPFAPFVDPPHAAPEAAAPFLFPFGCGRGAGGGGEEEWTPDGGLGLGPGAGLEGFGGGGVWQPRHC